MTLQTYTSLFDWAMQNHCTEIAWRKAAHPPITSTQFEVEHQKKAFLQKLVEVVRKCCPPNTHQAFLVNMGAHQDVEESAKIKSH